MGEQVPAPSGPGTVVLDIGGDVGAAVVVAPASWSGSEVEIAGLDRPWDGTHTMIRPRNLGSGTVHAGVFDSLRAGCYKVRLRRGSSHAAGTSSRDRAETRFDVTGGRVTYAELAP